MRHTQTDQASRQGNVKPPYVVLSFRQNSKCSWSTRFFDNNQDGLREARIQAELLSKKIHDTGEVRVMEASMVARWGPKDTGGALIGD